MTREISFFEHALRLAKKALDLNEVPVGAILVRDNKVLAKAYNQKEKLQKVRAHAELLALEKVHLRYKNWRLPPETTLYVTLEPCLMCASALLEARLDHIVIGCRDTKNSGLLSILAADTPYPFRHHRLKTVQVLDSMESRALLRHFFQRQRTKLALT